MICIQLLFVALFIGVCVGDPTGTIVPCKKTDKACIKQSAAIAFKKFIQGYPDHGVDTSDPVVMEEVVGDLSTLKFKFTNSTGTGLSNCDLTVADLDLDKMKTKIVVSCPNIIMKGHYFITGQLLILPVEGEGAYTIHAKRYILSLDGDLKETQNSDGKKHITIKNFTFKAEAPEPISFDFQNLFNGQKDLADGVLKFANENWKEVADFVQEPVIAILLKKVVKNFNKFIKLVPVEDLYLAD